MAAARASDAGETMPVIRVDIAEMHVGRASADGLLSESLGSCMAVTLWDAEARVGGLLRFMLPEAGLAPDKARAAPLMFCDTGVPLLFKKAYELGATKKGLVIRVAGGAQLMDEDGKFNLGKRNYLTLRKLFWKNNIPIAAEDVGGHSGRSVQMDMNSGAVTVVTRGGERSL